MRQRYFNIVLSIADWRRKYKLQTTRCGSDNHAVTDGPCLSPSDTHSLLRGEIPPKEISITANFLVMHRNVRGAQHSTFYCNHCQQTHLPISCPFLQALPPSRYCYKQIEKNISHLDTYIRKKKSKSHHVVLYSSKYCNNSWIAHYLVVQHPIEDLQLPYITGERNCKFYKSWHLAYAMSLRSS